MTACKYFSSVESNDGGHCGFFSGTVSYGVCSHCRFNSEPGRWPPAKEDRKRVVDIKGSGCRRKAAPPTNSLMEI